MGGFVIRGNTNHELEVFRKTHVEPRSESVPMGQMTAASTTDLEPGLPKSSSQPSLSSKPSNEEPLFKYHDPFYLTVAAILRLRKLDKLPKIPSIGVDDINDKSKSDLLAGVVSVAQII
jgi:hypothetical protein